MTALLSPLAAAWTRLTGRERLLVGVLASLAILAGAWYLVITPGFAAERSAESRLRTALSDQAVAAQLAAELKSRRAIASEVDGAAALEKANALAEAHGLTVVELSEADGGIRASLTAASSAKVLAWADAVSAEAAMRAVSLSVSPSAPNTLQVTARFARATE